MGHQLRAGPRPHRGWHWCRPTHRRRPPSAPILAEACISAVGVGTTTTVGHTMTCTNPWACWPSSGWAGHVASIMPHPVHARHRPGRRRAACIVPPADSPAVHSGPHNGGRIGVAMWTLTSLLGSATRCTAPPIPRVGRADACQALSMGRTHHSLG
jgi:hypothetical protein